MDDRDVVDADDAAAQERYVLMRSGRVELRRPEVNDRSHAWLMSRAKRFGTWEEIRGNLAVINIGAYHSEEFKDCHMLAALPSSRVCLAYA